MSIESLKQQARKHEQNEEWRKALDQYNRALAELARDEQVDIGLHNRVGDLYVRVGELDQAVEHYEKAVELYREAYLPNNAIAVCKKILRNLPDHHRAYLVIGQIRAEQGFIPDARTNFLTYAERMQHSGDLDESFRALIEFCDLAPEEVGVRITVAEQMAANDRTHKAVQQFRTVYQHFVQLGEAEQADQIEAQIREIDPDADLTAMPRAAGFGLDDETSGEEFGEIAFGSDAFAPPGEGEDASGGDFAIGDAVEEAAEDAGGDFPIGDAMEEAAEDAGEAEAEELPLMGFGGPEYAEDGEGAEEVEELPLMGFGGPEDGEDEEYTENAEDGEHTEYDEDGEDSEYAEDGEGAEEVEELPLMHFDDDEPASVAERQAGSEASAAADAPPDEEQRVAPDDGGGYVDFAAMVLGGGGEKSTRFTVAYEEPSGDEQADFAKMLSQFKEKVSENLDSSDVRAHYDLGTAYKEMGLLDEAITSFQAALRASAHHLATYEMMGQTFMEMGEPEAAIRTLERGVRSATAVEDELVGIYYYLGRAYEELERKEVAVDYYDRVFALDINFADVTERLRELR